METKQPLKPDYEAMDGFGRDINPEIYWRNTGLSQVTINTIKANKRKQGSKSKLYMISGRC